MSDILRGDGVIIRAGAVSVVGETNPGAFEARVVEPYYPLQNWPVAGPWIHVQPGDPSIAGRIFRHVDITHHAEQI